MTIYLLESAICMACFYGFYHLALRRETFFQWSRAYLLLTPLLALLLPALNIRLEQPPARPATVQESPQAVAALSPWVEQAQATPLALHRYDWSRPVAEGWSVSVSDALWAMYGVGAAALVLLLSLRFGRLYWLLRRCRRERHGDITFATSDREDVPLASFFGFVFWSRDAQLSDDQRFLLEHELAPI
ncbi:MAG TPA: hypothetical protein PK971_10270, partial [Saprospiraceae bacterium]|nr:hypothetical protein [Saprospiraceae bacterium]